MWVGWVFNSAVWVGWVSTSAVWVGWVFTSAGWVFTSAVWVEWGILPPRGIRLSQSEAGVQNSFPSSPRRFKTHYTINTSRALRGGFKNVSTYNHHTLMSAIYVYIFILSEIVLLVFTGTSLLYGTRHMSATHFFFYFRCPVETKRQLLRGYNKDEMFLYICQHSFHLSYPLRWCKGNMSVRKCNLIKGSLHYQHPTIFW